MVVYRHLLGFTLGQDIVYHSYVEARISEELLYKGQTNLFTIYFSTENCLVRFFPERCGVSTKNEMAHFIQIHNYGVGIVSGNRATLYYRRDIVNIRNVARQQMPAVGKRKSSGILHRIQIIHFLAGHRLISDLYGFSFPLFHIRIGTFF